MVAGAGALVAVSGAQAYAPDYLPPSASALVCEARLSTGDNQGSSTSLKVKRPGAGRRGPAARPGAAPLSRLLLHRLRYYDWETKRVKTAAADGTPITTTYFTYFTIPELPLTAATPYRTLAHPHPLSLRSTLSARTMFGSHGLHVRCCLPTWCAALPWPDP